MASLDEQILRSALANAVEHRGKANPGAVLGQLMASNPELRRQAKELHYKVNTVVEEVNLLDLEQQIAELKKLGGPEKKPVKEEKKGLPDLPEAQKGQVVVRFAPNPDGAIHLGNARPAILSWAYKQKYDGVFILRFDDTDPKIKIPEKRFYDWIKEDLKWLGIKPDHITTASKRLNIYYEFGEQLLRNGGAYIDFCEVEKWRKLRDKSKACPCRDMPVEVQLKRWNGMLAHKLKEGRAVYRIKTDLEHPNTAVRDWIGFRIVDKPKHPLNKKDHVWPLFNFASGIDDHELGVTHILRGQEHATNETKQRFLYEKLGWEYPKTIILGRFSLRDMVMSKSVIREGIEKKEFQGWDDIRLGTIRALRRRGFQAQALTNLILEIGPKSNDSTIAFENMAAFNRKIVDKIANRYFFVTEPVKITVKNPLAKTTRVKLHPDKPGWRNFKVGKNFIIEKRDLKRYKGKEIRLIGLYNIILKKTAEATDKYLRNIPKIHWLPEKETVKVKLLSPGLKINGLAEKNLMNAKVDEVVQFERFGFVRIESKTRTGITAILSDDGYRK